LRPTYFPLPTVTVPLIFPVPPSGPELTCTDYKHELDSDGIPQFGLIAEQVEKGESGPSWSR